MFFSFLTIQNFVEVNSNPRNSTTSIGTFMSTHPNAGDVKQQEVDVFRVSFHDLLVEVIENRVRHLLLVGPTSFRVVLQLHAEVLKHLLHAHVQRLGDRQFHLVGDFLREFFVELLRPFDLLARHAHIDHQEILQDQLEHVVDHAGAVVEHLQEVVDVGDDLEVRLLVVGKLQADLLAQRHWNHRHHVQRLLDQLMDELELRR